MTATTDNYDHAAQIEMPTWHRDRVVPAGDPCAAVSLLAGQGASLGIAGAYVLAEELHRSGPAGLVRYEQRWRPVVAEKQLTARGFLPSPPRSCAPAGDPGTERTTGRRPRVRTRPA